MDVVRLSHQQATTAWSSSPAPPVLQRKCGCDATTGANGACEDCQAEEPNLQRKSSGPTDVSANALAPTIVHEVLSAPGRPLDSAVRSRMEPALNHDFSQVRVHTDGRAAESARAVHASAYTVGTHVVFGSGRFAPGTVTGTELLAHELTHVVQQTHGANRANPARSALTVGRSDDTFESEADAVARRVTSTAPAESHWGARPVGSGDLRPQLLASPCVAQRDEEPGGGSARPPLIPIPVFDEFDPMVIVPDVPGVPSFLKGQEVKLSTLRKALEVVQGNLPKSSPGRDMCEQFLAGYETAPSGVVAGQCCPRHVRDPARCCRPQQMGLMSYRCCRSDEVVLDGRCFRPPPAPDRRSAPTPTRSDLPRLPPLQLQSPRIRFGTIESMSVDRFGVDSSTIPAVASDRLDHVARLINLYPEVDVHVEGHTDSTYTPEHNQELSERRANAVRDALVRRRVDPRRLRVAGFGDRQRLVPDDRTDEDKARNRRVDIWYHIPPSEGRGFGVRLEPPTSLTEISREADE